MGITALFLKLRLNHWFSLHTTSFVTVILLTYTQTSPIISTLTIKKLVFKIFGMNHFFALLQGSLQLNIPQLRKVQAGKKIKKYYVIRSIERPERLFLVLLKVET